MFWYKTRFYNYQPQPKYSWAWSKIEAFFSKSSKKSSKKFKKAQKVQKSSKSSKKSLKNSNEENLGVKGPKNNNNKNVGLRMTMPQAAGKKYLLWREGVDCGTCIKMPGCQHGVCKEVDGNNKPLTCDCEDGWKGALCNIRKCATDSSCGKLLHSIVINNDNVSSWVCQGWGRKWVQ